MKLNLSLVAIILSIIAIIVILFQPTYNFLVNMNTESGRPSFSVSEGDFTSKTYTEISFTNNGTAIAHGIRMSLDFRAPGHGTWDVTEILPELGINKSLYIKIPTPWYGANITNYETNVYIDCDELNEMLHFQFQHSMT